MFRIGTLIRCYGLTKYLKPVLKQYEWVDEILVMNQPFKNTPHTVDNTKEIVSEVNQQNVVLSSVYGNFSQEEVFNKGIELLKDYDLIFISDADEFLLGDDQDELISGMQDHDIGIVNVIDYAKDFNHRYPIRTHKPPVIIRPQVRFYDVRCYQGGAKYFKDIYMHHLGYVYTPEELKWKFDWEKEDEGKKPGNIMCQKVEDYSMPHELRTLLGDYSCFDKLQKG